MNKATNIAKRNELKRSWYIVDAKDKILGRVAAKTASIIRGKHKAIFTPHVDCGDYVVVINASKIRVTGTKLTDKEYITYSGYPGGIKYTSLEVMLATKPTEVIKRAVRRMLPRRALFHKMLKNLKIYANEKHPYGKKEFKELTI